MDKKLSYLTLINHITSQKDTLMSLSHDSFQLLYLM